MQDSQMERTSEVSTQLEIQHKEAILIILKRIAQIHDERMVNLEK